MNDNDKSDSLNYMLGLTPLCIVVSYYRHQDLVLTLLVGFRLKLFRLNRLTVEVYPRPYSQTLIQLQQYEQSINLMF